jgi:hypothetical protein
MHSDSDYAPFQDKHQYYHYELFLRYVEAIILLGSLIASILHFSESGKRLTDVTKFHLSHTLFCAAFFGAKLIHIYGHYELKGCR